MQYRGSFAMQTIGLFLMTIVEFAGIWVLFDRFGALKGWILAEVALFYGMVNLAFAISEGVARGFTIFPRLVRTGEFDRMLLRPRSTVLQILGSEFQLTRLGRFLQGLFIMSWAVVALDVTWTGGKFCLAASAVAGGACLFTGLFILHAAMAFWTVETLEIVNIVTYGGVETSQYPLAIYKPWFRKFFTLVIPLACVNYFPVLAILAKEDPAGAPPWFGWLSPLFGTLFLAATILIWNVGVRHYRSTGS